MGLSYRGKRQFPSPVVCSRRAIPPLGRFSISDSWLSKWAGAIRMGRDGLGKACRAAVGTGGHTGTHVMELTGYAPQGLCGQGGQV